MSEEPAQPITGLRPGDLGENVFLCGDPARVERIAKRWSGVERCCDVRGRGGGGPQRRSSPTSSSWSDRSISI